MALSTTFTQCAPKTIKFGKITQNKGHFAVQGHRFWNQSKAHLYDFLSVINSTCYLAPFAKYSLRNVNDRRTGDSI